MTKGKVMELTWRQTRLAWIAARPAHADERGEPLAHEVDSSIQNLCDYLLTLGGTHVCVPFTERDSKALLRRGKQVSTRNLRFVTGDTSRCHANSAKLWKGNRKVYRIMTGYALSSGDGMWRQHSWLFHKNGYSVETTEARSIYFGMALNLLEALVFSTSNKQ